MPCSSSPSRSSSTTSHAYSLIALSLLIGTPFFIVFGWLSDRIGRLKIILAGCSIAAVTYFPLFRALTHYVNPDLEAFQEKNPITVTADQSTCNFHIFVGPWSNFTAVRPRAGLPHQVGPLVQDRERARRRSRST